jgi:hypothetical protein
MVSNKIKNMKQLLPLFLLLLPCLALAQYPSNGNQKITLGEQTTADGLIWRGVASDTTLTAKSDTAAYFVLDTVNKKLYFYKASATPKWNEISGSSGGGSVDSTLIAYVNTYGTQMVNGAKTLTSNLILKNSQEPSRASFVTNQTFAADTTNWTRGTGWTFNGTQAVATAATGDLTYTPSLTITSGNAYEITYTVTGYTGGTLTARVGNASLALPTHNITGNIILLVPTSATGGFRFTTSSFTGNLDNVSVVEITGAAPVLFAGQDDGSTTLYNSLRMPNSTTLAFGGGGARTTGVNNNFIGTGAGNLNTTGANNNFIGNLAGASNTSGSNNNFFGNVAGNSNTTGSTNGFYGPTAGRNNTTGNNNVFFGSDAGLSNTTGSSNVFFNTSSGRGNTTGNFNNFFGASSGRSNTTGSYNIAIGDNAMYNSTDTLSGDNNIAIGRNAGTNIRFGASGNVIIGRSVNLPDANGSDQVVIKNIIFATGASGTGTTIAGSVGIGTNAPQAGYRMTVNDSLYVGGRVSSSGYTTRSDYNLKDEIKGINYGLNEIMQIMPVSYTYKSNGEHQLGFIAQDIGVIIPESVHFDGYMGVDYQSIIPILTKAIQEQQALIKALEQRIINLENK